MPQYLSGYLSGHLNTVQGRAPAVVAVKIDALGDLAPRNRQKERPAPTVARAPVVVQRQRRLHNVLHQQSHK